MAYATRASASRCAVDPVRLRGSPAGDRLCSRHRYRPPSRLLCIRKVAVARDLHDSPAAGARAVTPVAQLFPTHRRERSHVLAVDDHPLVAMTRESRDELRGESQLRWPEVWKVLAPEQAAGDAAPAMDLFVAILGRYERQHPPGAQSAATITTSKPEASPAGVTRALEVVDACRRTRRAARTSRRRHPAAPRITHDHHEVVHDEAHRNRHGRSRHGHAKPNSFEQTF